jgi:hypothetical protein
VYHHCCGENHAEVNSIANATENVSGSTLYVTLGTLLSPTEKHRLARIKSLRKESHRVVNRATDFQSSGFPAGHFLPPEAHSVTTAFMKKKAAISSEVFLSFNEKGVRFVTVNTHKPGWPDRHSNRSVAVISSPRLPEIRPSTAGPA